MGLIYLNKSNRYNLQPNTREPVVWILRHYCRMRRNRSGQLRNPDFPLESRVRPQTQQAPEVSRAGRLLGQSEEKYRSLFQNAAEVISIYKVVRDDQGNAIDGVFQDGNPAHERVTGIPTSRAVGKKASELFGAKAVAKYLPYLQDVIRTGRARTFENYYEPTQRHSIMSIFRLVDGQYAVASTDITDLKRAQEELKRAKEAAEAADREKSQFLGVAIHELRTPLTSFRLMVQNAMKGFSVGKSVTGETLERIARQTERLALLVNDLLDVSRLDKGFIAHRPEKIDLNQLVAECVETFKSLELRHPLSFERPAQVTQVDADPARIQQVVSNLLENAHKYSPPASPIEVRVDRATQEFVRVSVSNQGPGIPAEEQARLFTPFFRIKSGGTDRAGLGLGLFICRKIIELHGGSIGVRSEPGRGSTFYFDIPVKSAQATLSSAE